MTDKCTNCDFWITENREDSMKGLCIKDNINTFHDFSCTEFAPKFIDCKGTYVLVCPYCGKDQRIENWELEDYEENQECKYCGETYIYEREVIALYTSKKK